MQHGMCYQVSFLHLTCNSPKKIAVLEFCVRISYQQVTEKLQNVKI